MLWRAQVSEEPNDDDVVMIRDECSFSCLLDTEDKDGEEDMLHANVVRPPESLLSYKECKIYERLLQLRPWQCLQLLVETTSRPKSWSWARWSTQAGQSGGHEVKERFQEGANVLILKPVDNLGWRTSKSCKMALDEADYTLFVV
jgi:hypothetical protein